jgi:hypothetical protein
MIAKIFEEVNNMLKEPYEKQSTKKRPHVNGNIISKIFATKIFYKKMMSKGVYDIFALVINILGAD